LALPRLRRNEGLAGSPHKTKEPTWRGCGAEFDYALRQLPPKTPRPLEVFDKGKTNRSSLPVNSEISKSGKDFATSLALIIESVRSRKLLLVKTMMAKFCLLRAVALTVTRIATLWLPKRNVCYARLGFARLTFRGSPDSPETRIRASPKAVLFVSETRTTPASVIGGAVSLPAKAMTGRPQAMPAMALPRRLEMGPRTKSRTSDDRSSASTSPSESSPPREVLPANRANLRAGRPRPNPHSGQIPANAIAQFFRRETHG
jgi:hypothetical protein